MMMLKAWPIPLNVTMSRARISATLGDGGPLAPSAVAFELRYPR
jgi:hypothetical protein